MAAAAARATPAIVFAVALASTLLIWRVTAQQAAHNQQLLLARRGDEIATRVRERLSDDEQLLLGGLGLFQASNEVKRGDWRRYVAALRMAENFPGIQGVGYSVWLPAAELERHVAAVRAEGFPEYLVRPTTPRPFYSSIVFLEPFDWRNQRAFGFDMYSEPTRREAMEHARDTGNPALSSRVTLLQETEKEQQSGVLLFVPVYRARLPADGVEARRAALRGWVYSPIRIGDLIRETLGELPDDLAFTLRDAGDGGLLFASKEEGDSAGGWPRHETALEALGRRWVFSFVARPGFVESAGPDRSSLVLATGLATSVLLAFAAFTFQRKAAERAAAEESTRRRILFEASPDGMVVIDHATTRILEFNTSAHHQLGYSREEFARLSIADVEAAETAEETRKRIEGVLSTGWADFDTVHRTKHGELRNVHVTAQVIDVLGQQVYQCIWRDVTARRRAEDALRAAHRQLQRLGDNLPGGYVYQVLARPDGTRRFTYLSAGVEQVHGVKPEEALKDPMAIYGLSPEDEQRRVAALELRSKHDLQPFSTEVEVRGPSGEPRWVRLSSAPVQLPDGSVQWDGIALDVTDRVRAEADRLVLSKLESTGILAGGIAHDFNNLLTTMMLGADLARSDPGLRPDGREALEEVVQAIRAARELTQQLIIFSRGGEPVRRLADLERLVREAVSLALTGATVSSRLAVAPGLWPAQVDEGQIGQVVRNLVLNAREAMPAGGTVSVGLRNVTLSAADPAELAAGPYLELTVSDSGPGIAPEVLPRIFDPYFSTKDRGKQKGMGLGLTICHSVVQKHGGAISAGHAEGGGALFRVLLPPRPGAAVEAGDAPHASAPARFRGRVLVMDDEEGLRRGLAASLEQLGCSAVQAADGKEALAQFVAAREAGDPFDLTILDLTVRDGMGGLETLGRLREVDPRAAAVLMSGFTGSDALLEPARHGFRDALRKPFDLAALRAVLARNLPARAPPLP